MRILGQQPYPFAYSMEPTEEHGQKKSETLPSEAPRASEGFQAALRRSIIESAKKGDENNLWITADSAAMALARRFLDDDPPVDDFSWHLHHLWFIYYQAAMHTFALSPCQHRLAFQLIQLREQGPLQRRSPDGTVQAATTSDGRIWTNMPFFVTDMTKYWTEGCASMSAVQRVNFSRFLANLASTGFANDGLGGIALAVMRATFETPRHLGTQHDQHEEDATRQIDNLSIAALLPAANNWFFAAGHKLIQLSGEAWNKCDGFIGEPGELLEPNEPNGTVTVGFSPERWLFWLKRLEQIALLARQGGDAPLASYAERMMDNMLLTVEQTDNKVRNAMEAAGGVVQHRPTPQHFG